MYILDWQCLHYHLSRKHWTRKCLFVCLSLRQHFRAVFSHVVTSCWDSLSGLPSKCHLCACNTGGFHDCCLEIFTMAQIISTFLWNCIAKSLIIGSFIIMNQNQHGLYNYLPHCCEFFCEWMRYFLLPLSHLSTVVFYDLHYCLYW